MTALGGKRTLVSQLTAAVAATKKRREIHELLRSPEMRVVIASLVALMFGYDATAIAQTTNQSEIRVTPRVAPVMPPPECHVLNRPRSANGPRSESEVLAERRRIADSWLLAPTQPKHPRAVYCGVVPSAPLHS
jgi:hypothetical protein